MISLVSLQERLSWSDSSIRVEVRFLFFRVGVEEYRGGAKVDVGEGAIVRTIESARIACHAPRRGYSALRVEKSAISVENSTTVR